MLYALNSHNVIHQLYLVKLGHFFAKTLKKYRTKYVIHINFYDKTEDL